MQQPFQQGHLDSLCGIYSIVNGFCHLMPELSKNKKLGQTVFELTIKVIPAEYLKKVIVGGLSFTAFEHKVLRPAKKAIEQETGLSFSIKKPFKNNAYANEFLDVLRPLLEPVQTISFLWIGQEARSGGDHWSVLSRITEKSLLLVDSSGYHRIPRHKVVALAEWSNSPFLGKVRLDPRSTITLSRGL